MPVPIARAKSTFDNGWSKTLWHLSISTLIELPSFISALNMVLKTY